MAKIFFEYCEIGDYIFNYCNRPFENFVKFCREWYLSHNSDDNEIRVLDDIMKNMFLAFGYFSVKDNTTFLLYKRMKNDKDIKKRAYWNVERCFQRKNY